MQIKDFVNAYLKGFKIIPHYDPKTQELFFDLFEGVYTNIKYQDISKNIVSESIKRNDEKGVTLNYDFSSDDLFPEKQPDISKFRYIGEYNTPDDLPTPSSVSLLAFVKSSNAYYVSQITSGITFERYRERMDDIVLGDGSEPYLIPYSPFYMDSISIDNDGAGTMRTFLLPKINEVGSSLFYKIGINDPLFKVLIWHGMVDGPVASKPYAFASSYNIDQNSNKIGDLSLILSEDDDSAYVQFLKNYFYFLLNTKRVDHVYTNNFKSPLSYDFTEKKLIVNQRFLTGKLSIKITKNGVDRITAENYKV
ncbi:MAG: hypothetical protein J5I47_10195 [Vicingus serpentipes]|nr:hypothetical protein [Vicingus serpentipes]